MRRNRKIRTVSVSCNHAMVHTALERSYKLFVVSTQACVIVCKNKNPECPRRTFLLTSSETNSSLQGGPAPDAGGVPPAAS